MIRSLSIVLVALSALAAAPAPEAPQAPADGGGLRVLPGGIRVDRENRVIYADGEIVLREGALEFFVCSRGTKEHETVIAIDGKPFVLNMAVLSLNVRPGRPVDGAEAGQLPEGPAFSIHVRWTGEDGKVHNVPGGTMVKRIADGTDLGDIHWVYSGSRIGRSMYSRRELFMADETGTVIAVWHTPDNMFDLRLKEAENDRAFIANNDAIPPVGTKVEVILRPVEKPEGAEKER